MTKNASAILTASEDIKDRKTDFDKLLTQVAKEDQTAFIEIFDYFAPRVKSFLMRGNLADSDAEELAQETMTTVWQKAAQFDPYVASASTWIYTIARNKKIDRLRKNTVSTLNLEDLVAAGKEPEAETTNLDWSQGRTKEKLAAAIQSLPEEQAFLVRKAFYDDLSHADIAKQTHIPLGTVKSRLRIGLAKLRKIIFDNENVT